MCNLFSTLNLYTEKHVHFTTPEDVMILILFKFLYCSFMTKKSKVKLVWFSFFVFRFSFFDIRTESENPILTIALSRKILFWYPKSYFDRIFRLSSNVKIGFDFECQNTIFRLNSNIEKRKTKSGKRKTKSEKRKKRKAKKKRKRKTKIKPTSPCYK